MAFKMTPGITGSSSNNSIMGGGCGGDNQPPCPPRFQAEKITAPVADRSSRSKSIKSKKKAAPAQAPPVKLPPKRLKINLPEGHKFRSKLIEANFYKNILRSIDKGEFASQEQLDLFVTKKLSPVRDPFPPIYEVPGPDVPVKEGPIFEEVEGPIRVPIKEGPKAAPVRGVAAVKAR